MAVPPPRLRQMCPTLAYVKEDCCMGTLGSMQLKLSAGPVARTPPFPHPPTCPPTSPASTSTTSPTYLPTCIYINYIYCIHHLPTPPTSYPTALATTRPPLLLLTSGVQHTPRRSRPRPAACPCPAPCPAVKVPGNGPRDPGRHPHRPPQTQF